VDACARHVGRASEGLEVVAQATVPDGRANVRVGGEGRTPRDFRVGEGKQLPLRQLDVRQRGGERALRVFEVE